MLKGLVVVMMVLMMRQRYIGNVRNIERGSFPPTFSHFPLKLILVKTDKHYCQHEFSEIYKKLAAL
jgi:hypothetical protein